jgi:hypothetical protein
VSLFRIDHNGTGYYVEARSMSDAIAAWKRADKSKWGSEDTYDDDPGTCTTVSFGPVIRADQPSSAAALDPVDGIDTS